MYINIRTLKGCVYGSKTLCAASVSGWWIAREHRALSNIYCLNNYLMVVDIVVANGAWMYLLYSSRTTDCRCTFNDDYGQIPSAIWSRDHVCDQVLSRKVAVLLCCTTFFCLKPAVADWGRRNGTWTLLDTEQAGSFLPRKLGMIPEICVGGQQRILSQKVIDIFRKEWFIFCRLCRYLSLLCSMQ